VSGSSGTPLGVARVIGLGAVRGTPQTASRVTAHLRVPATACVTLRRFACGAPGRQPSRCRQGAAHQSGQLKVSYKNERRINVRRW
jgi:hypothetical protein